MIEQATDVDSALLSHGRLRALIDGRGPRIEEFLLNSYRFGGGTPSALTANLWGAYSINKILPTYVGSALRVRRSSDNAEQDIGFSGTALDTASLASFVGLDSAYVTRMYDQSGIGGDVVQVTAAKQPRLISAGVYDGFVRFDGAAHGFQSANSSGTPTGITVFLKGQLRSTGTGTQVYLELSPDGVVNAGLLAYLNVGNLRTQLYSGPSANRIGPWYNTSFRTAGVHGIRLDRTSLAGKASQLPLFTNGVSISAGGTDDGSATSPAAVASNKWNIGARDNAASLWAPLNLTSMLIYEAAKSDADMLTISGLL